MKYVPAERLAPGMITTKPIYGDGTLILASNHTLTENTISAIKRNNIAGLYIFDEYSSYEQLNQILNEELRRHILKELKALNIDQVIYLSNQLVDSILAQGPDLLLDFTDLIAYDQNMYQHSVNVALLSATCGVGLGLGNEDLQNLALAGTLHDIGKNALPRSILDKKGPLTPDERLVINRHPRYGYDMLYGNTNVSAFVRSAILSHHENWDGSGYPNHLAGDKIPLFGMILHIADVYDALIQKRSYKEGHTQQEAIEYLMGGCGSLFDLSIVKVFLSYIVVYPVGMSVTLSDGRTARVIQNKRSNIMRPVVMIEEDKTTLDLADDKSTYNIVIVD